MIIVKAYLKKFKNTHLDIFLFENYIDANEFMKNAKTAYTDFVVKSLGREKCPCYFHLGCLSPKICNEK